MSKPQRFKGPAGNRRPATSRGAGQSLIEVTVGLSVLIAVVLALLDISLILRAVESNDSICRSAARAAASGNPDESTDLAQTVVDRRNECNNSTIISSSVLLAPVDVNIDSEPVAQRDRASGEEFIPGGPVSGSVTATTEVEVRPFVLHYLVGRETKFVFRSRHSFPITYVAPAARSQSSQRRWSSAQLTAN